MKKKQHWTQKRKIKKQKEKHFFFFRIIYYFLFISFLAVVVYVFFCSHFMVVSEISIEGLRTFDRQIIQAEVNSFVSGKYLKFIPKNNFFLLSEKRMEKFFLDNFKKISSVEIRKIFPDRIEVKVQEREALLLWCSGGPCYIIDEEGYAYTGADFESAEIKENNLVRIVDKSGQSVEMGEKVLDENRIRFILEVWEGFWRELKLEIADEFFVQSRSGEDVIVIANEGWRAYFNNRLSAQKTLKTLGAFLRKESDLEQRKKFEYVDLRIENRIYYKIKKEEKSEEDTKEKKDEIEIEENEKDKRG